MKKLLLLLLFIPLISLGQVKYKDIRSIDSKDDFLKLMVDKKYSGIESDVSEFSFALNPNEDGQSSSFAYYYTFNNTYEFEFVRTGTNTNMYTGAVISKDVVVANTYDPLLKKVKRRCEYVEIKTIGTRNYAIYDCDKYDRNDNLIGLTTSGQSGIVKTFNRYR